MPYADVRGQRVHYEDTGGDGPPIVLSHGFLMDHTMFAPQVEALRGVYRVITWDERGFGRTAWDGEPFTYWDSARDVLELLTQLGIERAVLGGMSQGGFLSLRAALTAPDRVRGLVLIGTQAGGEDPGTAGAYRQLLDRWATEGYDEDVATTVSGLIVDDPRLEEAWREKWRRWDHRGLRTLTACLLDRDDVTERLAEIDVPALVVHGGQDRAIPVERARRLCEGLPDCRRLVEVPGASHAANLTRPDAVTAAIRDFLEGLPA